MDEIVPLHERQAKACGIRYRVIEELPDEYKKIIEIEGKRYTMSTHHANYGMLDETGHTVFRLLSSIMNARRKRKKEERTMTACTEMVLATVPAGVLKRAIESVLPALEKSKLSKFLPVVKIEVSSSGVSFSVANAETFITATIPPKTQDGPIRDITERFVVDGKQLKLWAKNIKPKDESVVEMSVMDWPSKTSLSFIHKSGITNFELLPQDMFTEFSEESGEVWRVEGLDYKRFAEAVETLSKMTDAKDLNRPSIGGIYIQASPGYLKLTATNGYQMGHVTMREQSQSDTFDIVVSSKALKQAMKALKGQQVIELALPKSADAYTLDVHGDGVTAKCQLVKFQFPKYETILKEVKEHPITVKFPREELFQAVSALAPMTDPYTNMIVFTFSQGEPGQAKIIAKNDEDVVAERSVPCSVKGLTGDLSIPIKASNVLLGLELFTGKDVRVNLKDDQSPVGISEAEGFDICYATMPIRE